jgi:hypothetical protein
LVGGGGGGTEEIGEKTIRFETALATQLHSYSLITRKNIKFCTWFDFKSGGLERKKDDREIISGRSPLYPPSNYPYSSLLSRFSIRQPHRNLFASYPSTQLHEIVSQYTAICKATSFIVSYI